ncbi:hypothetical protein O181_046664 [Austropuccinia psidii MF-1]|uniref:Uncharacterized protein n=1 Tax=Austropuccinia psidii MF-1 TaxID=1389203 RepID=A0A9Q3HLF4_9BASI|nr:hypothetical protein [Austropuccinia psidii MF-1]
MKILFKLFKSNFHKSSKILSSSRNLNQKEIISNLNNLIKSNHLQSFKPASSSSPSASSSTSINQTTLSTIPFNHPLLLFLISVIKSNQNQNLHFLSSKIIHILNQYNLNFSIQSILILWKILLNSTHHHSNHLIWYNYLIKLTINLTSNQNLKSIHLIQFNKFLNYSFGILIRHYRLALNSNHSLKFKSQLINLFNSINQWQNSIGNINSNLFIQRKLQITDLLGSTNQNHLDEISNFNDPYLISTTLKSPERLNLFLNNLNLSQNHLIHSMKVICRSKGQLIHQIDQNHPYQVLNSNSLNQILNQNHLSNLKKTGLLLSWAQCLLNQIRFMINQNQSLQNILIKLNQLINLNLLNLKHTIYGGHIENYRLLTRKTDGLELVIDYILNQSLNSNFSRLFDLIQSHSNQKNHPNLIRKRTWKKIFDVYLQTPSSWLGLTGLKQLLDFLINWLENKHQSSQLIKFNQIWPRDLGLLLLDRVLFPEDVNYLENFESLLERLDKIKKITNLTGNPRRFRQKRLKRLIILAIERKRNEGFEFHWSNQSSSWNELDKWLNKPLENDQSTNQLENDSIPHIHQTRSPQDEVWSEKIKSQTDSLEHQLRVKSRDYFQEHSIIVCLIQLIKNWICQHHQKS